MKAFTALLAVALFAYTVSATPCSDICGAKCSLQKQTCEFSLVFGQMCDIVNGICTKSCDAACGCADKCEEECGGKYATCKADGKGLLSVYGCSYNLSVCSASCQIKCKFGLFASIVDLITNIGGGSSGGGSSGGGSSGGDSGSGGSSNSTL